jgi:hypothetical protein
VAARVSRVAGSRVPKPPWSNSASEHQYYEFVAVVRPLTAAPQGGLPALTPITSSRVVNDYQRAASRATVGVDGAYFDAFLYLAV